MLELEYELREEDLIRFNEEQFHKSEVFQKKVRNSRLIVPGILLVIATFYVFYYGDVMTGVYIGILGIALSITSPMLMKWSFKQQVLKHYSDKEKVNIFGHYKLVIDPNHLIEKSPSGKNKMDWSELLRVEYGDKCVYIYVDLDTALIIPVETVTKGDLEEFAEKVEDMIERLG